MRTSLIACLLLVLVSVQVNRVQAQKNVIKVNPLSVFLLTGSGAYERAITPEWSAQIGGYYSGLTLDGAWMDGNSISYRVWAITPEARFHPMEQLEAPNGFFFGPFLRYRRADISGNLKFTLPDNSEVTETGTVNINTFGGGVVIGYQAILAQRISLEAFLGPGVYYNGIKIQSDGTVSDEVEEVNAALSSWIPGYNGPKLGGGGFGVRSGITLGVAF